MNKIPIFMLIFAMLVIHPSLAYGQAEGILTETDYSSLRNPFESQLPRPVIEVSEPVTEGVEIAQPEFIEELESEAEPVAEVKIPAPVLKITGLIWDTDRPQVIIDGIVMDVGDSMGDLKIVSIQKGNIEVNFKGVVFQIAP